MTIASTIASWAISCAVSASTPPRMTKDFTRGA
jgi:hypothetical protein